MFGERSGEHRSLALRSNLPLLAAVTFFFFLFVVPLSQIIAGASIAELLEVIMDVRIQRIVTNTFIQAALSSIISLLLATPVAYLFAKYTFPGATLVRALFLVPFFTPAFAFAEALFILFDPQGVINRFLMHLFSLQTAPISLLYSMNAVVLAHVFYYTPLATILLEGGFSALDQNLIDASHICGASDLKTFRRIVAHQLAPALAAALALVFVFSFLTFSTPLLVGGNFYTTEVEIYYYWSKLGGWTKARTLSLLQLAFNMVFVTLVFWGRERVFRTKTAGETAQLRKERFSLGLLNSRSGIILILSLVIVLLEVLPVYAIIVSSFGGESLDLIPRTLTLSNFRELFQYDFGGGISFLNSMTLSVLIATFVSLVTVFAALTTAYGLVHSGDRGRSALGAITSMPLAVSSTAMALALYASYGVPPFSLYGRWELIALAHMLYAFPLTTRIIESALVKVNPDLVDASLTLGASRVYTFFAVEVPIIGKNLFAASLVAFSSSLSEFTFSYIFSVAGIQTMPVLVTRLLDRTLPLLGVASAGTSIILALIFLAVTASAVLARKGLGLTL